MNGVELRPMDDGSRAFVAKSWKAAVVDALRRAGLKGDQWPLANAAVDTTMLEAVVTVAVSPGDPDVFHGFVATLKGQPVFAYVKPKYQGMGIDRMLREAA